MTLDILNVHGEVRAAQTLADHIKKMQWNVRIPGQGNSITL
jgi:hypothetical protein